MLLYLIYALYHKVACKRLISIEILLFDVLALLKYCLKQVTLTNVIWNDRTFHASVLLVEDPKTLSFFVKVNLTPLYMRGKWNFVIVMENMNFVVLYALLETDTKFRADTCGTTHVCKRGRMVVRELKTWRGEERALTKLDRKNCGKMEGIGNLFLFHS